MSEQEPVTLYEDEATGDRFLVYGTDKGLRLDVRYEGETVWMTQAQMSQLFGRDVSTISRHIANILDEGELDETSSLQKAQTTPGRPSVLYNLDMIVSVGYRVSSPHATLFRRWATGVLVQFATKGFVVDAERLKRPESRDRFAELREIIRDIRSDEANMYWELRDICAMCQDYDPGSEAWQEFFRNTQAKLMYAVTNHTPAEIIQGRADAASPNMDLTNWPNDNIRKADVTVSKNYLADGEMRELNRLTSIILDIFEDQLDIGRIAVMSDVTRLLDQHLKGLNRPELSGGGSVQAASAKRHAECQYDAFDGARRLARHKAADAAMTELKQAAKDLRKKGRKP